MSRDARTTVTRASIPRYRGLCPFGGHNESSKTPQTWRDCCYHSIVSCRKIWYVNKWLYWNTHKTSAEMDGKVPWIIAELQRKQTSKPRKFVPTALRLLKREIKNNPSISARQIKDNNPILGEISGNTIRKTLRVDLKYKRRGAKKIPLITARQQRIK